MVQVCLCLRLSLAVCSLYYRYRDHPLVRKPGAETLLCQGMCMFMCARACEERESVETERERDRGQRGRGRGRLLSVCEMEEQNHTVGPWLGLGLSRMQCPLDVAS